jgi:two-component system, OmpR family, phosphate regulon sensor histidine kinase PhoR
MARTLPGGTGPTVGTSTRGPHEVVTNDAAPTRRASADPNPVFQRRLRVCAATGAVFTLVVAGVVLAGWLFDVAVLRTLVPGLRPMKANAALALVLLAGALLLRLRHPGDRRANMAVTLLCAVAFALGAATLLEYLGHWDLRIDELLARERNPAPGVLDPGRISPTTAVELMLLGSAMLLMDTRARFGRRLAEGLAMVAALTSLAALFGYLYSARSLYLVGDLVAIALPAAVACFVLSLSVLAARPDRGLAGLVASDGAGGAMVRRVMPALLIVPLIGWLGLVGLRQGRYATAAELALMVTATAVILFVVVWTSASAVHGIDAERIALVRELDDRVESRTCELTATVDELNAIADENQRLNVEKGQLLRTEKLFRDLSQKIRIHLQVADVVEAAVAALGALGTQFDVDRVYVRLTGDKGGARIAAEWTGPGVQPVSELSGDETPTAFASVFAELVRTRQSLLVNDVTTEVVAPAVREALAVYGARAIVACPLSAGPETRGVLVLQVVDRPHVWTAGEIVIAEMVALEISVAMSHAHAYDLERDAVAQLQELDNVKSSILSSVSHELRTPLTSIMGYVEMLTDGEAGELTAEQLKMVGIVERNGGRLLTLIEDLLTLSRVEAGSFRLTIGDVGVGSMLQAVIDSMAPLAAENKVTLSLDVPPDIGTIAADPDQLERAMLNLVSNAVKFTRPGGWVTISVGRRDDMVRLRVRDSGIGIPVAEQDKLFTRFFRSSISQQQAVQGTGLGLSIVKNVIEQHGGTIEIESVPGEGTTVTVLLPVNGKPAPLTLEGALV